MTEEFQPLKKTYTWDLVDFSKNKIPISCKWVYKMKTCSDGTIEHYIAHLVAKGYTQEYGTNYDETFALLAPHICSQSLSYRSCS